MIVIDSWLIFLFNTILSILLIFLFSSTNTKVEVEENRYLLFSILV